jgi:hypothetical protein
MAQTAEEAKQAVTHWDRTRFDAETGKGRTNIHPAHWPDNVRVVSLEGLTFLGMDDKGHLYLDGEPVYTAKRWSTVERWLAGLGLTAAWIGAAATAVQAWVSLCSAR